MGATKDFWTGLGVAIVIFSLFFGLGQCSKLSDLDGSRIKIEKEKTKQLELQLEIIKQKDIRSN
jgi:hypothetical protein